MSDAVFVLSTGRCGTQWLADALTHALGDRAVVTHEPLDNDYAPRAMLGGGDPQRLSEDLAEPLLEHIDFIENALRSKAYVECGHPSWSSIPYLVGRFGGRVKIVHLVRHPVETAYSWLAQMAYCPPPAPHVREKILVSPFDEGARFPAYRERWPAMTPYEKALYYWLEVNSIGVALEESGAVPLTRIRYESLFGRQTLEGILKFIGFDGSPVTDMPGHIDRYHMVAPFWIDPRLIARHQDVVALAARLGYDPLDFDEAALRRRHLEPPAFGDSAR